jgi:K+-sensing histidine kinase KdpD
MEPLIRRSAALAAQVSGEFRVAAVRQSQPGTPEDVLLADYAALTEQLGGEFVALTAAAPAAALADYARDRDATELVLARTHPSPGGRHPVLRDLAKLASDVELHVLPAEHER